MEKENWKNILDTFLDGIDNYIKQHINTMTCDEVYEMYKYMFDVLKKYRGSSNGFTGFSELILFRVVYHILGGDFILGDYRGSRHLKYFVSKDNKLWIGQNVGFDIGLTRKKYPDIVICDMNGNIQTLIQIKLYLTNGKKELQKVIELLRKFRSRYPDMRSLLIIYHYEPRQRSKLINELDTIKNNHNWFYYCILKGNQNKISSVLKSLI